MVVQMSGRSQHIEDKAKYRRLCRAPEAGSVSCLVATCRVSGVVSCGCFDRVSQAPVHLQEA
jgi:hypothetical protein